MISLDEIKQKLIARYNLQDSSCGFSGSLPQLTDFVALMEQNPDKVAEIEEQIGKGEDFRSYFVDKKAVQELLKLHEEDVDAFYRILRKEELFLNTCLKTFGLDNMIISLNPETLLDHFDDGSDDDDYEDENGYEEL